MKKIKSNWSRLRRLFNNTPKAHLYHSSYFTHHCSFFPLASKAIFGTVHQALDVATVLYDNENANQGSYDGQREGKLVIHRIRGATVAHDREDNQHNAGANAPHRNILGRNSQNNPHTKCGKGSDRAKAKEDTQCSKNTLTTAETGKAGVAMAKDDQKTGYQGKPGGIICATSFNLSLAHNRSNERTKETLQQVHEHNRKGGLPAKDTESIG